MSSDLPAAPSDLPSTSSNLLCTVCGAPASGRRYGAAAACLACIVFFRRSVLRKIHYTCQALGRCEITVASRCVCRYCRMQKCLAAGMDPRAIQIRDLLGPRSLSSRLSSRRNLDFSPILDLTDFLSLQRTQCSSGNQKCFQQTSREATSSDINSSLKLAIEHANSWALKFNFYENFTEKTSILSEFAIGFMLIDQAFKTAEEAENGFWLLQNGTFLVENEHKSYSKYVSEILNSIAVPFKNLKIEEFECVILKILLFLSANSLQNHRDLAPHRKYCFKLLTEHRSPPEAGEIILLLSSIRCVIKSFYNVTRISDIFNVENFDDDVKVVLVE
ncbi:Nuclear receptor domain-containing protein [Caenorhabditis elegans]|uniref:Nuclear receptor domain-containing protein n=1 Tax=Caenorhabditis elegans TaxID=6239 RepID=Q9U1U2_CAEEL|nr:Nuclear receptor domain-containing protein [Caenorhabditis elegans]CAB63405.2 Nuclear receptor domain-containing protein [Caenorhabditis elegans]|eukprot:NP_507649.2 Nuclear Hormone Receptor family [Caenorhabditis elegans]